MEAAEIEKITAFLPKLIKQIDCNTMLISELEAAQAIGPADVCQLNTFTNIMERSRKLLNIMCTRKYGYTILVEGLRKTRQTGALETLQESTHPEPTHHEIVDSPLNQFVQMQISEAGSNVSAPTSFKKIPFQSEEATELFTGRRSELDLLIQSLLLDGGSASIIGIGGIGKTELAKMFLQTLDEEAYENIFRQIIWINCESAFTASTDFTSIAKDYLEVPIIGSSSQQRDTSSILNDVYDKLQKSKSLVVLDNVETREILQMCMPKTSSKRRKVSILITSQNSVLKIGTLISLGSLQLNEAVEFVKKGIDFSSPISEDLENSIAELVLRLEMFPLALSQAIAYINDRREMYPNYKPHDYLVDLDRIPERLLDGDFFIDVSSQGKTTYKTLVLALLKIEASKSSGLLAKSILSKVAFMAPDNMPLSFFYELAEISDVEGALVVLKRFSIIKYTPRGKSGEVYFSIHRVVQDVLRIRFAQQNETESIVHSIMTMFCLNIEYNLIHHALETWRHATKIHSLVEEFSSFPVSLICKMLDVGQISDGIDFALSSLTVLKQNLSIEKHASTIFWLQALIGYYLGRQGKFKETLEYLETTLHEAKEYLHKDHFVILKLRYFFASICLESGQIDKAAFICDELYKKFQLGNIESLRIIFDIGFLQRDLRRLKNALETTNYILANLHLFSEIESENLENDTRRLLASIHGRMGNYDESINLYSGILQTHLKNRKIKDSDHESYRIYHGMGTYQYCAGRFEDAHDSYQKALNEMTGQNEKDCIWILYTKCNIASLMLARNMVDKGLPFSMEVHETMKKLFDEKEFWALQSLGNIGVAYSKIGRHQDAVSILTKLVDNESFVTQCSDEARFVKFHLAISLEQTEYFEKAILIFNELRIKCLEYPNYKLHTLEQVEKALVRLNDKALIVNK